MTSIKFKPNLQKLKKEVYSFIFLSFLIILEGFSFFQSFENTISLSLKISIIVIGLFLFNSIYRKWIHIEIKDERLKIKRIIGKQFNYKFSDIYDITLTKESAFICNKINASTFEFDHNLISKNYLFIQILEKKVKVVKHGILQEEQSK